MMIDAMRLKRYAEVVQTKTGRLGLFINFNCRFIHRFIWRSLKNEARPVRRSSSKAIPMIKRKKLDLPGEAGA